MIMSSTHQFDLLKTKEKTSEVVGMVTHYMIVEGSKPSCSILNFCIREGGIFLESMMCVKHFKRQTKGNRPITYYLMKFKKTYELKCFASVQT